MRWAFQCPTIPLWRRRYGLIIALPFLLYDAQEALHRLGVPRLIAMKSRF